jgi:hypothetical protein
MISRLLENPQTGGQRRCAISWRPLFNEKTYQKSRLDISSGSPVEVAFETETVSPSDR